MTEQSRYRPCEPHDPVTEECDGCAPDAITRDLQRRQDALVDGWKCEIEALSLPDLIASFGPCDPSENTAEVKT